MGAVGVLPAREATSDLIPSAPQICPPPPLASPHLVPGRLGVDLVWSAKPLNWHLIHPRYPPHLHICFPPLHAACDLCFFLGVLLYLAITNKLVTALSSDSFTGGGSFTLTVWLDPASRYQGRV